MAAVNLIRSILDGIVDNQYEVKMTLNNTNLAIFLEKSDMAKVIGRKGRTISEIRKIITTYAKTKGKCIGVTVSEKTCT